MLSDVEVHRPMERSQQMQISSQNVIFIRLSIQAGIFIDISPVAYFLPLFNSIATSIPPDRKVTDCIVLIGSATSHGDIFRSSHWSHLQIRSSPADRRARV